MQSNIGSNKGLPGRIVEFYVQGMKSMGLGKTLWKIIAIKLFIIFFVFKLFFFPDMLDRFFHSDAEKAEHVSQLLISPGLPTQGINQQQILQQRR